MAIQLLPIVKAVAPYLAQVASVAIPAFTSRKENAKTDPVEARQIEELQAAASQNAQSIQVLADKLQQAVQAIENAAKQAEKQVAIYKVVIFATISLSVVSLLISLLAFLH